MGTTMAVAQAALVMPVAQPAQPVMPVLLAVMNGVQLLLLSTVTVVYAHQIHLKEPVVLHSMQLIVPVIIIKCVFVASGMSLVLTAVPLTLIAMVYVPIQRAHVSDNDANAIKPLPLPLLKLNSTVSM